MPDSDAPPRFLATRAMCTAGIVAFTRRRVDVNGLADRRDPREPRLDLDRLEDDDLVLTGVAERRRDPRRPRPPPDFLTTTIVLGILFKKH
jgi:hypothetical protein